MCKRPFYNKEQGIYCPCGQCEFCLKKRIQDWTLRMMHQYEISKKAVFLTLTYSNENLPSNFSLRKVDFQKFMKRLRRHLDVKIKYYGVGEYGEKTNRPHYHCIIFGLDPTDCEHNLVRLGTWSFGLYHIGRSVEAEACAYVAKYVTKIIRSKEFSYAPREKPFQLVSQGLGKEWCDEHADSIKKNCI